MVGPQAISRPTLYAGRDYPGVCGVFFCHDGNGEMLFQLRGQDCQSDRGRWDVGAGRVHHGETAEAAVIRKIQEEYGVAPITLELLGHREALYDGYHWITFDWLVHVDRAAVKICEPTKVVEIRWVPIGQAPEPAHSQVSVGLIRYSLRLQAHVTSTVVLPESLDRSILCRDVPPEEISALRRKLAAYKALAGQHRTTAIADLLYSIDRHLADILDELEMFRRDAEVTTPMAEEVERGVVRVTGVAADLRTTLDMMLRDLEAAQALNLRQADLLTRTAKALRGPPGDLEEHSHHDIPERAAAVVRERDTLRALERIFRPDLSRVEDD